MSLFGWFGGGKSKTVIKCKKGRGNTFDIYGESYHQSDLLRLAGGSKTEFGVKIDIEALLEPEPDNPHDPSAVAVFIRKRKVGYLAKIDAPTFVAFLKANGATGATCTGRIVGGWNDGEGSEGHFGVKLSLSWPPKVSSP